MRRNLKITQIISAMVFVGLGGFPQNDGDPFSEGREAHETYLLSLHARIAETGHEYPEGPEFAGYRDYIMTMNPETRRVPDKALYKAARLVDEEKRNGSLKSGYMFNWTTISSNTGGRTRAVMYDPNDPEQNKVWAGGVTGGLWYRNIIRGVDIWRPVNDFWPSLAISCITYDPNDTKTFYVGTGEGQTAVTIYRESSGRGAGIWKSDNAGTDWEVLGSTGEFEYVTDIAVRNESGKSVIYTGVCSGIYKGQIHTSKPNDGLFRSEDGGITWSQVLPDIPGTEIPFSPAHIEITAGNRIFVGTMRNIYQEGGGRILYSDNGIDWTVMDDYVPAIKARTRNNIPGRVILAAAPSDEKRIYAILAGGEANPANGFVYSRGVMIIVSINGGVNWSQVTMPLPRQNESEGQWSFLAWHALTAAVQPNNPDVLWVGGLDLYRSDDAGMTWSQKSLWYNFGAYYHPQNPTYVHADQHSLIYKPGSNTELLNSNDGGVFLTTNATYSNPAFKEVNQGYNTLQYYTCAIHPEAGKRYFMGGCQDNGTFRTTYIATSKEFSVSYGDGAFCFIDEDEPNFQISGSQNNYYYYSNDGNHNQIYGYNFDGGTFINPVDYDHIGNTLYANGMTFEGEFRDQIFRIQRANDTLLQAEAIAANTGSTVPFSAVHVLPWKENGNTIVFAGSQSGKLYRLDNAQAGISASEIGSPDFPVGYISCVQTGSTADQILVTFSNYGVSHVWETTDGGNTWKDKTGNLPDIPVRWALYPPGTENVLMLATELGVWYSSNINADPVTWIQSGDPFPNVRVDMLRSRKSDNHILAATHGRGLFLSSGAVEVSNRASASPEGNILLYPNPASDYINLQVEDESVNLLTFEIFTSSGKLIMEENLQVGRIRISLEGMEAGTYILRAKAGNKFYSQTFIKKE